MKSLFKKAELEHRRIVLFLDRNKKDPAIQLAEKSLKIFLKKHCPNSAVCPHGKYLADNDIGIIWSIPSDYKSDTLHRRRIHELQRENRKPLLVVEKGFLHRDVYFSIGWNSIVGYGEYHNRNMPSDRFERLNIKTKPHHPGRNRKDGYILLCGQVPWDTQVQHLESYRDWLMKTVEEIRKVTNREIVYRPHPKQSPGNEMSITSLPGTAASSKAGLEDEFEECHAVVSFNSNSLVEALIAGIPFFGFDRGSMAFDLANQDLSRIETPGFPEEPVRMQKLYDIAYAQWNSDEIKSGEFWKHLMSYPLPYSGEH